MDVDKYGNVTSNLTDKDVEAFGLLLGETVRVTVNKTTIEASYEKTYGTVSKGAPVLLMYESLLQLAINEGNFARKFELTRGSHVLVER